MLDPASAAFRPTLGPPWAFARLGPPPSVVCAFDPCGSEAVAETLSVDGDDSDSTDPDERSELLEARPLETAVMVSPSLAASPFCRAGLGSTAEAPVPCPDKAITEELEPLIQTIPDSVVGPADVTPDAIVPEVVAG